LMCKQASALGCGRLEPAFPEIDVAAVSERVRAQLPCRIRSLGAGMNPDVTKILVERVFHRVAGTGGQRVAARWVRKDAAGDWTRSRGLLQDRCVYSVGVGLV